MNLARLELPAGDGACSAVKEFHFELRDEDMRDPANAVETRRFTLKPKKQEEEASGQEQGVMRAASSEETSS